MGTQRGWKRMSVISVAAVLSWTVNLRADTVASGSFPGAGPIITGQGLTTGDDTPAETFTVPGAGSVDLKFTLVEDAGDFLFTFGFYDIGGISASIADEQAYMTEVISEGTVIFDQYTDLNQPSSSEPAITMNTVSLTAGTQIGFFLIPNDSAQNFNGSPADYFFESEVGYNNSLLDLFFNGDPENHSPTPTFSQYHQPMSSEAGANFADKDQLLSLGELALNKKLLLIWEDLSRADDFASDPIIADAGEIDFNDLALTVEVVPEPMSLTLIGMGGLMMLRRRRH